MNDWCACGNVAVVKYVVYSPVRVWSVCGTCALVYLGDEPARVWAVMEATGPRKAVKA